MKLFQKMGWHKKKPIRYFCDACQTEVKSGSIFTVRNSNKKICAECLYKVMQEKEKANGDDKECSSPPNGLEKS